MRLKDSVEIGIGKLRAMEGSLGVIGKCYWLGFYSLK